MTTSLIDLIVLAALALFAVMAWGKTFLGVLATHPLLDERSRAIDPGWDGTFRQGGAPAKEAGSGLMTQTT